MFTITFEDEVNKQWTNEYIFTTYGQAKKYLIKKGFIENNRLFIRKDYNWSKYLKAYISHRKVFEED